jgi:predicted metal-dependent phosphotriesterase family hydrolase
VAGISVPTTAGDTEVSDLGVVLMHEQLRVMFATGYYTYDNLPFPFHFRGPGKILDGDDHLLEPPVRARPDSGDRRNRLPCGGGQGRD